MNAKKSSLDSLSLPTITLALPQLVKEGGRYLAASALALAIDAGIYLALIRVFGVNYLVAAPAGFAIGVLTIYVLSTRWVFPDRRLDDSATEFAVFVFIGMAGLLMNQVSIYLCIERLAMSYEAAKFCSAASTFIFNFATRKVLLFTRVGMEK